MHSVTSVCLCVCLVRALTFERLDHRNVSGLHKRLQHIYAKVEYQGHQVKVKVAGAK